jgi:hypothetical protein
MKWFILSLFLLAFASCSRFNTPHYRKLKLVPATESMIIANNVSDEKINPNVVINENSGVNCFRPKDSVTVVDNNTSQIFLMITRVSAFADFDSSVPAKSILKTKEMSIDQPLPVRRDWSVLIAILLLFGGISLLLWSIAISIALPAPFWVRLLIGIGMIPLSVRMILLGARILINRRRNPVNYKESQH